MDATNKALPEQFLFKKGMSKIYKHHDAHTIVQVKEIIPETQKSFEDAKGNVISDYQNFKEENWINALKEKYTIQINEKVLKTLKSQINK